MSDEAPTELLGGLPRTRPHRRSDRRAAPPPRPAPKQPRATPRPPRAGRPAPPSGVEIVSTLVQAVAELAEIGLSVGARTVRNALERLPRP